jgi:hypothetical protein
MTPHVGFLSELPVSAVLDGELVALDEDGKPDFGLICECLLQRRFAIPLTYMVFDVLSPTRHKMPRSGGEATQDGEGLVSSVRSPGQ